MKAFGESNSCVSGKSIHNDFLDTYKAAGVTRTAEGLSIRLPVPCTEWLKKSVLF